MLNGLDYFSVKLGHWKGEELLEGAWEGVTSILLDGSEQPAEVGSSGSLGEPA